MLDRKAVPEMLTCLLYRRGGTSHSLLLQDDSRTIDDQPGAQLEDTMDWLNLLSIQFECCCHESANWLRIVPVSLPTHPY